MTMFTQLAVLTRMMLVTNNCCCAVQVLSTNSRLVGIRGEERDKDEEGKGEFRGKKDDCSPMQNERFDLPSLCG